MASPRRLAPTLVLSLVGVGASQSQPIRLSVEVSDAREIAELKAKISSLIMEVEDLEQRSNNMEYLYIFERGVNSRLIQLLRDHRIKIPRELFDRPVGFKI